MNKKCQIFTPNNIVDLMLDEIGYCKNLSCKKILENSCGNGNILCKVVERYINDGISQDRAKNEIKMGLEIDITGFEIDPVKRSECICRLNNIAKKYEITDVCWNIKCCDYLKDESRELFDFIVGNPPYICYADLSAENRQYLHNTFKSCSKGKFDYCYAFIEKSINSLNMNGKFSYVIPSSIFKNAFAQNLRNLLLPSLIMIRDFPKVRIFEDALVKSSIIFSYNVESKFSNTINYRDELEKSDLIIEKSQFQGKKWYFKNIDIHGKRFGDYFHVSYSVATLLNSVFLIGESKLSENNLYSIGNYQVESELVKNAASPKLMRRKIRKKIIFPYKYGLGGDLIRYNEEEFKSLYPQAFKYLKLHKKELELRNIEPNSKWFEYGRSQALSSLNCEKLLLSTVVSSEVHVYKLNTNYIPFAGMYIVLKSSNKEYSLDIAVKILRSKQFFDYILKVGSHVNGNSVRITAKDIENYRFEL